MQALRITIKNYRNRIHTCYKYKMFFSDMSLWQKKKQKIITFIFYFVHQTNTIIY